MQHNGVNYNVTHGRFYEIYHLLDGLGVETRVPDGFMLNFQIIKMIAKGIASCEMSLVCSTQGIGIFGFDPALRNVREAGRREAESRSSAENVAAERKMQHNGVNYNVIHGRLYEIYHLLDGLGVETRVPGRSMLTSR
ncbi:hypothetical protein CDAR_607291 [Caerostris darwini]|uniref:Uncharacterized protein n=1 Tax=Caerostris darwini TaxID=1538125 RepID=A0AAV4NJK9_9ARAC|nr:hypothetical protein CDAR_607291 [Caerostris darwini]